MNILNPQLVWIDGHCFRKLPIRNKESKPQDQQQHTKTRVKIHEEPRDDESYYDHLPIKHDGDRFFVSISVPEAFVGRIQGKKGIMRKSLEEQHSTHIRIPPASNKNIDSDIVIVGRNKENVAKTYNRIESICHDVRRRMEYTHFVSIPMNNSTIIDKYNKFKNEVLTNCKSSQGVCEDIFISPAKLHITIAMLTLLTSREQETVAGVLQKHKKDILHLLGGKSLCIEVKGIEYMNDDPSEVDILYGMVKETDSDNCLQMIADNLADAFANTGLSRREATRPVLSENLEKDHIKLHVTLMKSRSIENRRVTFDARKILKDYAGYSFGQMTVTEIHVSVRFTGGRGAYYTSNFVLNLSK